MADIYGTNNDDTINGTSGADLIDGLDGADIIYGGDGNDTIDGRNGRDYLYGEGGDDIIIAGHADETDFNSNYEGAHMFGGEGNDQLYGDNGSNLFYGGVGNDIFYVHANGYNQFHFEDNWGTDHISSNTVSQYHNDLYFHNFSEALIIDPSLGYVSHGLNTVTWDSNVIITDVGGGEANDVIYLSGNMDANGYHGDDIIHGGDGSSYLRGWYGTDTLYGNLGDDNIWGDQGNDLLYGGEGNDRLSGGSGNDLLYGGNGDDKYIFDDSEGHDFIDDSSGAEDVLDVSTLISSMDAIQIQDSNSDGYVDQLKLVYGNASTTINNFFNNTSSDYETSAFGSGLIENFRFAGNNYTAQEVLDYVSEFYTVPETPEGSIAGNNLKNTLQGTENSDQMYGFGGDDTIHGYEGIDVVFGGDGRDKIYGGADADVIYGEKGSDYLYGGDGNDTIYGGIDGGSIYGEAGDDTLYAVDDSTFNYYDRNNGAGLHGGSGNDDMYGGNGTTSFWGGEGNDNFYLNDLGGSYIYLSGDWGNDTIITNNQLSYYTNVEFDSINVDLNIDLSSGVINVGSNSLEWSGSFEFSSLDGSDGDDVFYLVGGTDSDGGKGNDIIYGGDGSNRLSGREGIDYVYGMAGDDWLDLDGKGSHDYLFGGSGNDMYNDNISPSSGLDASIQTISDESGTADNFRFWSRSSTSLTSDDYSAVDTDGNGVWDRLVINLDSDKAVYVENYFDNENQGQAGLGLIEDFNFQDITLHFEDIKSLIFDTNQTGGIEDDILQGQNLRDQLLGGDGNDTLYGQGGDDSLSGGNGNDFIDGGSGTDTMNGGDGDDVFVVDETNDVIVEVDGQGYDTVLTSVNYTMSANVEKLRMQGSNDLSATGNDSDNQIFGNAGNNSLDGGAGNDVLNGGAGDDAMVGGAGDDFYYVDTAGDSVTEVADEGVDTVYATMSYTAGDNVENVRLFGAGNMDATGNALDNKLTGTSGSNTLDGGAGNDTLDGGSGVDTLIGGTGDDWYLIRNSNDVIVENAGEGDVDYAFTYVNYTLSDNIEQLRMYGNTNLTGTGNAGDNALYGNYGNNTINGMDGNDFIDGGVGGDVMRGGLGDDVIVIDSVLDNVIELADEGYDTVLTKANYTMADNIEKLRMQTNANLNATGNDFDNVMIGNSGDNTINGGAGADNIVGLGGADTFAFDLGSGLDSIGDFTNGTDLLDVSGWNISDFNDLIITAVGGDTTVAYEADGADMITLQNVDVVDIDAADFVFA